MPAWNAAAFIGPVLDAYATQTYPNLELLISVDSSDDDTAGLCERFASGQANVRVVRQRQRLGWTGNVNALLALARGDGVLFAAHDDTPQPRFVERMVDALARHPHAVLAYPDVAVDGGTLVFPDPAGDDARLARLRQILAREENWYVPYRGLFRMAAARRLRRMRCHLAGEYMADWPWLLRLAMLGAFVRVPEPLVHKATLARSLSHTWGAGLAKDLAVSGACVMEILRNDLPLAWKATLLRETCIREGRYAALKVRRKLLRSTARS